MTREQMEADGYGFHHASEDGKYLIMANGTQAYAVRADAPEKDTPLRTAEMTLEDDYGMIDGVINNGLKQTVAELEEQAKSGKPISLMELAQAARREKAQAARQEKKPSVLAKLCPPVNEPKKTARSKRAERELL